MRQYHHRARDAPFFCERRKASTTRELSGLVFRSGDEAASEGVTNDSTRTPSYFGSKVHPRQGASVPRTSTGSSRDGRSALGSCGEARPRAPLDAVVCPRLWTMRHGFVPDLALADASVLVLRTRRTSCSRHHVVGKRILTRLVKSLAALMSVIARLHADERPEPRMRRRERIVRFRARIRSGPSLRRRPTTCLARTSHDPKASRSRRRIRL